MSAPSQNSDAWPELHLADWRDTRDTLHMWTQLVGKLRLALSARINHWWEVPLYVSARGLTTSPIPYPGGIFEVQFDFIRHEVAIQTSRGDTRALGMYPRTVADFYKEFMSMLRLLGIEAKIWPMPVEVLKPIRFDEDTVHASYDAESANRFWRILVTTDTILKEFRARFIGKDSPVHFFWGSFDMAVTRFSGRRAVLPPDSDPITREAYSHEVSSAGIWPGGIDFRGIEIPDSAYYCYFAPQPPAFRDGAVRPPQAFYHEELGEFLLMYEDVRTSDSPKQTLMDFLQSTYEAGANLAGWDRDALERK